MFDALTSVRSYKAAMSHETAIGSCAAILGTAFDPAVFAKFEAVVRDGTTPIQAPDFARHARDSEVRHPALELATTDRITGLPMRDSMLRIMAQELADRQTTNGTLSLLAVQLDEQSPEWREMVEGHRLRALRAIARELRNATRTTDFVASTGQHQFMALLPGSSRSRPG